MPILDKDRLGSILGTDTQQIVPPHRRSTRGEERTSHIETVARTYVAKPGGKRKHPYPQLLVYSSIQTILTRTFNQVPSGLYTVNHSRERDRSSNSAAN